MDPLQISHKILQVPHYNGLLVITYSFALHIHEPGDVAGVRSSLVQVKHKTVVDPVQVAQVLSQFPQLNGLFVIIY